MTLKNRTNAAPQAHFDTVPLHVPPVMEQAQPVRVRPKRRGASCSTCLAVLLIGLLAVFGLVAVYFLAPMRTNLLVLGIDRSPEGTSVGRSDTIILVSVVPLKPVVTMLSIPRDLWLNIPGQGENRINTAHFFAEAEQPGSGPAAAVQVIEENFNVRVPYYVRLRFDSVQYVVEAMGGVNVHLTKTMAGLPPGDYLLDGPQALAFARERRGADDFYRMEDAQFLVKEIARQLILPSSWSRLPAVISAVQGSVDTNLPIYELPRIGLALLRAVLADSIDNRTINRDMVQPFLTDGGAQVLLPKWDQINPVVDQMFR